MRPKLIALLLAAGVCSSAYRAVCDEATPVRNPTNGLGEYFSVTWAAPSQDPQDLPRASAEPVQTSGDTGQSEELTRTLEPPQPDSAVNPRVVGPTALQTAGTAIGPAQTVLQAAPCLCEACVRRSRPQIANPWPWSRPVARSYFRWQNVTKPRLQESHWGYCDLFCERPVGTLVQAHEQTQIANGLAGQLVLYRYDFVDDQSAELNDRGKYQLEKLARLLTCNVGPLVIQRTEGQPKLDAARRQEVIDELTRLDLPFAPDLIVVGRTELQKFRGAESLLIDVNNLNLIQSRGASAGGSTGGSSGGFSGGVAPNR